MSAATARASAPEDVATEDDALLAWRRVHDRLSELARAGRDAQTAVAEGDATGARGHVNRIRGIRAALARDNARTPRLPTTPRGVALLADLGEVRVPAATASRVADTWIRGQQPDDAAGNSAEYHRIAADRLLPPVWDADHDLAVIVGTGGAAMAHALTEFGQKRILVYVPPSADEPGDPRAALPAHAILVRHRSELRTALALYSATLPQRTISWRTHREVSDEDFQGFNEAIKQTITAAAMGRNTVHAFGGLWVRQALANLPAIASSPRLLAEGLFRDIPMVIVAPGPSLDKNILLLREVKGHALIVAVSHAMSSLTKAGIVPDVVLAADMEDLRYHFDGSPLDEVEVLGLAFTVHPDLYTLPAKRVLAFASNGADEWIESLLGEKTLYANGGSVAHIAFALGLKLGCNPITLVGQDLSYPGGKVYGESNIDADIEAQLSTDGDTIVFGGWGESYGKLQSLQGATHSAPNRAITVPGYHGGTVVTSPAFAIFRQWFTETALQLRRDEPTRTLLNCTEGGAYVDGLCHVSLRQAIDEHMTDAVDIPGRFAQLDDYDAQPTRDRVLQALQKQRTSMGKCRVAAGRCLAVVRKIERGRDHLLPRLAKAEKVLSQALAPVRFLALEAQQEFASIGTYGRDATSLQDNLALSKRLAGAVLKTAGALTADVDRAIERLAGQRGKSRQ